MTAVKFIQDVFTGTAERRTGFPQHIGTEAVSQAGHAAFESPVQPRAAQGTIKAKSRKDKEQKT